MAPAYSTFVELSNCGVCSGIFRSVPLSNDPEKRARQVANLRKGPAAAAKNFGLDVVDYVEPEPAPSSSSAPKRSPRKAENKDPNPAPAPSGELAPVESSGPSVLLVLGGGALALVLLVVILNRTGGAPNVR